MMAGVSSKEYQALLGAVKERIRGGQYEALRAVNKELIALNWDIGRMIVERQREKGWGKAIVTTLAQDLQGEFPGVGGFSAANLWRMKLFFETYSDSEKLAPLVREIGWSHNLLILEKCKDDQQREFYLKSTRRYGWTKNVLHHQIDSRLYERTLLNQTNFERALPADVLPHAKLAVKDEYMFGFLDLAEEHSERQLELAILANVEPFLREMGGVFTFVGSQVRLEVGDQEFFIDLLLYHRALQCLVAIELKVVAFMPEHVGKMQFYLAVLDDTRRMPGENPSIGIILCRTKNKFIVEYALRDATKPIGVAAYQVVSKLPVELAGQLPDAEQVARLLANL
jgi:predicted nuclease of restriction endonuclease-like (RecB) superfamily